MAFAFLTRHRRPVRTKRQQAKQARRYRHILFESLEDRRLLAAGWHNALMPTDVNDDGKTAPIDALMIINKLEADGSMELPALAASERPSAYYDTTNDGVLSPIDALRVINYIDPVLIEDIRALSQHYMQVDLSGPATEELFNPDAYILTGPDSTRLNVLDVSAGDRADTLILTTSTQDAVQYTFQTNSTKLRAEGEGEVVGSSTVEPFLETAIALTNKSLLLTFSSPLDATSAEDADFYRIVVGSGDDLNRDIGQIRVDSASLSLDGRTVELATSSLDNLEYLVKVVNVKKAPASEDARINPTRNTATFFGIPTTQGPVLLSAASTSENTVLLTFDEPLAASSVDASDFQVRYGPNTTSGDSLRKHYDNGWNAGYSTNLTFADNEDVEVIHHVTDLGQIGMLGLSTTNEDDLYDSIDFAVNYFEDDVYVYEDGVRKFVAQDVLNVGDTLSVRRDSAGVITYRRNDVVFHTSSADRTGPLVVDGALFNQTEKITIKVDGQERTAWQYTDLVGVNVVGRASEPLFVVDSTIDQQGTQITLTTASQPLNSRFALTAGDITDLSGNLIEPNAATAVFTSVPVQVATFEDPKVLGAISTSNTTVVVSFSEPMSDSVLNRAYYSITPQTANSDAGILLVTGARFVAPTNQSTVELTTASQSEVEYSVHVVNVLDVAGNPLSVPRDFVSFDPSRSSFRGTPATGSQLVDSDGDGLTDDEEQRGWVARWQLVDGTVVTKNVTSDPFNPNTDGDGFNDNSEKALSLDPRDWDTDADLLEDEFEYNHLFGNPAHQDTDGDGIDDFFEHHDLKTSAILADTDGDQIPDNVEIILGNRNPLVADLPTPAIEVGDINLQLAVTFSETNSEESRELDAKTVSSTLQQSESREHSRSNSNTQEASAKLTVSNQSKVKGGLFEGGAAASHTLTTTAEAGWTGSWTSEATDTSSAETQRAYENSLNTEKEASTGSEVTRNVEGASMQVTLFLQNASDLAYRVKNLQVTAFIQDPQDPTSLTPIATLLPDAEPEEGYTLGPLTAERGPFILSSDQIFPELVESLMKNPRGLVFRISNFDIVDELDRNFAFASQDITDRTSAVVIDHGTFDGDNDGEGDAAEIHRVATGSGRFLGDRSVTNETLEEQRAPFDDSGNHTGITLRSALAAIGLTEYDELATPYSTLTNDEIENSYSTYFDDNGNERIFRIRGTASRILIDNPATPEDETETLATEVARAWEIITPTGIDQTIASLDERILNTGDDIKLAFVQDIDQDRLPDVLEAIYNSSDNLQDTDGDGLDDRFEALVGWTVHIEGRGSYPVLSSPSALDSDGDGLTDAEEAPADRLLIDGLISTKVGDVKQAIGSIGQVYASELDGENQWPNDLQLPTSNAGSTTAVSPGGYTLGVQGIGKDTYLFLSSEGFLEEKFFTSNPGSRFDPFTAPTVLYFANGMEITFTEVPPLDSNYVFYVHFDIITDYITDPFNDDTDGDGISDFDEVNGFSFELLNGDTVTRITDPTNPDTDGDTAPDGLERRIGGDPTDSSDRDQFADDDGDGLANFEEITGWNVVTTGLSQSGNDLCVITCAEGATTGPFVVTSDPNDSDSDDDGLLDGEERDLGTNPYSIDTDNDGLTDFQEVRGFQLPTAAAEFLGEEGFITTNPLDRDTDNDKLSDGEEAGYAIFEPVIEKKNYIGQVYSTTTSNTNLNLTWPNDVQLPTSNAGSATAASQSSYTVQVYRRPDNTWRITCFDSGICGQSNFDVFTSPTVAGFADGVEITFTELPPLALSTAAVVHFDIVERENILSGESRVIDDEGLYWIVRVQGTPDKSVAPYRVFTDPRVADRDYDKVVDGQEQENSFDPSRFDTDGDHTDDFKAAACGIGAGENPIKLRIEAIEIAIGLGGDGSGDSGEISYAINYVKVTNGVAETVQSLESAGGEGISEWAWQPSNGGPGGRRVFGPNAETLLITDGDAVELRGTVREHDSGSLNAYPWDRETGRGGLTGEPQSDNYFTYSDAESLDVNGGSIELIVIADFGTGNTVIPTTNGDHRVDFAVVYRITRLAPTLGCGS